MNAVVDALSDSSTPESEGVEVDSITVAGAMIEVKDGQGNVWQIPAEEVDDLSDLDTLHPFGHLALDQNFHYQICGQSEVSSKMTEGFVPVKREEVGLKEISTVEREFGTVPSTIVHTGGGVLMKIPAIIAKRRQKRKDHVARAVREATEPTPEMLSRVKQNRTRMKSAGEIQEGLGPDEAFVEQDLKTRKSARLTG